MCCRPFFNNRTTPSPTTWKNKPAKRQCMKTIRHPELYKKSTRNRTNDDDTLISDVVDYILSCRERERYTFCGVQTKMQRWRHILFTIPDMSIIIAFAQSRSCLIAHPVFCITNDPSDPFVARIYSINSRPAICQPGIIFYAVPYLLARSRL